MVDSEASALKQDESHLVPQFEIEGTAGKVVKAKTRSHMTNLSSQKYVIQEGNEATPQSFGKVNPAPETGRKSAVISRKMVKMDEYEDSDSQFSGDDTDL
jgi:hypothetical protein